MVDLNFRPGLIFKSLDVDSYDFEGIVKLSHCSGAWYHNLRQACGFRLVKRPEEVESMVGYTLKLIIVMVLSLVNELHVNNLMK